MYKQLLPIRFVGNLFHVHKIQLHCIAYSYPNLNSPFQNQKYVVLKLHMIFFTKLGIFVIKMCDFDYSAIPKKSYGRGNFINLVFENQNSNLPNKTSQRGRTFTILNWTVQIGSTVEIYWKLNNFYLLRMFVHSCIKQMFKM